MSEAWKRWEGQIVDGQFPLRQYLGGSEHSVVFLTERADQEPHRAAVKLILADPASAEIELSHWKAATQLFHPHLLRLFQMGRYQLDDTALLYLVMECADESLSQILPQRALTPEETRDMLQPVLDALVCVHRQGFVHGRLKPANIMAVGDKIKLSTDSLIRSTEMAKLRKPTAYDPPEAGSGKLSPASDIWSLGITLVETLTQHVPVWERVGHDDPILPKSLPAPFYDIVRNCLRRDPQRRCTVADVSARLNLVKAATPVSVASVVAAVPLAAPARPPQAMAIPPGSAAKTQKRISPRPAPPLLGISLSRYIFPVIAVSMALVALLIVPKLWNRGRQSSQSSASTTETIKPSLHASSKATKASTSTQSPSPANSAPQHPAQTGLKTTSEKRPVAKDAASKMSVTSSSDSAAQNKASAGTAVPGEVLDQVLPDVSQKARDTIRGKVRLTVKVEVDASGNITSVNLEAPGPSQYFADQAVQAAQRWEFAPGKVNGSNTATTWLVRFEFSQTDTQVFPRQIFP